MSETQVKAESGKLDMEPEQAGQIVNWLEEQRRQDKEQLSRLGQEVERLAGLCRELSAQVRSLEETVRTEQARSMRVTLLEESVRQVKEPLASLEQQLEIAVQSREQALSVLQMELARHQGIAGDLGKAVRALEQRDESTANQVGLLSHEQKNLRSLAGELARRVDAVANRMDGLAGKAQLVEEQMRKADGRQVATERDLGLLKIEQERVSQWQQAADLRLARQTAEWQTKVDGWQRVIDEQNHTVQQYGKQLTQGNDEVQTANRRIADLVEQAEERSRETHRLETLQQAGNDAVGQLKQLLDRVQSKIDEQARNLHASEDAMRVMGERVSGLQHLLDRQRERSDSLAASLGQTDQRQRSEMLDLAEWQQKARVKHEETERQLAELRCAMDGQLERTRSVMVQFRQMEEQHRLRQIAELQRLVQDLRETEPKA